MDSKDIDVKLVLLGGMAVGKTSLSTRILYNEFKETTESTHGVSYNSQKQQYDGVGINFQIWDTAGQERFKSITQLFYQDSEVACCVYDITSKQSFEKDLKYWIRQIKKNCKDDIILIIIGNKQDLIDDQEVQYDEANKYAKENNATLKLTSAQDGKGIDEMFNYLAQKVVEKYRNKKEQQNPEDPDEEDKKKKDRKKLQNPDKDPEGKPSKQGKQKEGCC